MENSLLFSSVAFDKRKSTLAGNAGDCKVVHF